MYGDKNMKKKQLDPDYVDFGEWLYNLRMQKGYSEIDLVEKIDNPNVDLKTIKKWERDLDFPDLNAIYKLSEIYMVSSTEIIDKKNKTLKVGIDGVNEYLIRVLSLIVGTTYYGAIAIYWTLVTIGIIAIFILLIFFGSIFIK